MIDYEYFMDRMSDFELSIFLDNVDYAYVDEWEQTRLLLWGLFKVNAGKKWNKKPSDLIQLISDEGEKIELTDENQERIKQLFINASKTKE